MTLNISRVLRRQKICIRPKLTNFEYFTAKHLFLLVFLDFISYVCSISLLKSKRSPDRGHPTGEQGVLWQRSCCRLTSQQIDPQLRVKDGGGCLWDRLRWETCDNLLKHHGPHQSISPGEL